MKGRSGEQESERASERTGELPQSERERESETANERRHKYLRAPSSTRE